MDLNSRKFKILQAIIDDYILYGIPVGSRTISKKYNMGLSSATIRNEMSDLEELGYLEQPHVSAGRIPSVKAYRLYVDSLIKSGVLEGTSSLNLQSYFNKHIKHIEDILSHATQVLSELTNYTALAILPKDTSEKIRNLKIIPVTKDTALLILVMQSGSVYNKVIRINSGLSVDTLNHISNLLTESLSNKNIDEVSGVLFDLIKDLNSNRDFLIKLSDSIKYMVNYENHNKLTLGGTSNIFNYPEYASVEKAKSILTLLDTQDELVELLKQYGEMQFTVKIGPENGIIGLDDCSIITATYSTPTNARGTIGIIGPTRMPYKHIIQILNNVSYELTNLFDDN
ncbi:MAG: heat-inducible transcription repressor HrcA [Christensenellaceae bacterium]|nr:heat-inducible transcription repressor HrcA [Christensenellaceae bacterium]